MKAELHCKVDVSMYACTQIAVFLLSVERWEQRCTYESVCYKSPFVVQELCDKLWDICDHRKQEAEQERERVMAERWLEDKLGTVSNFYFLLIQVSPPFELRSVCVCVLEYTVQPEVLEE